MKKRNRAFSLIELSIVVLVIGVLVAGITQGSSLYDKFKIQTARKLTQSSPVNGIRNLVLWYDASSASGALNSSNSRDVNDENPVSRWYDLNSQTITKNDATQSTSTQMPIYKTNSINGLPSLIFDGADDLLSLRNILGGDMSIFAVMSNPDTTPNASGYWNGQSIIFADIIGPGNDMVPMTISNGKMTYGFAEWTQSCSGQGVKQINDGIPHILNIQRNLNSGAVTGYVDGAIDFNNTVACRIINNGRSTILIGGGYSYFKGNIAEIIVFERFLSEEERVAITNYLAKKYSIKI